MVEAAKAIDSILLDERLPGAINMPLLEVLSRQLYAFEVGFSNVKKVGDWLKPKGGAANWVSKVDFDMIARINPRAGGYQGGALEGAEAEVKAAMTRDALLAKAKSERPAALGDILHA